MQSDCSNSLNGSFKKACRVLFPAKSTLLTVKTSNFQHLTDVKVLYHFLASLQRYLKKNSLRLA